MGIYICVCAACSLLEQRERERIGREKERRRCSSRQRKRKTYTTLVVEQATIERTVASFLISCTRDRPLLVSDEGEEAIFDKSE